MAEDGKDEMSRRSFLKVGGGAIGARRLNRAYSVRTGTGIFARDERRRRAQNAGHAESQRQKLRVEVEHRNTWPKCCAMSWDSPHQDRCDRGECGACTVIIMAQMYSCSQLAVWMEGKDISRSKVWRRRQTRSDPEAFIEHDGPQCGFCTSGQIMSGKALLLEKMPNRRSAGARGLSGNLCPA